MAGQQLKILTVLSASLCVAALVWLFGGQASNDDTRWDPDAAMEVWALAKEEIAGFRTVRGEQDVVLRLEDGAWWVTEPKRFLASPAVVAAALDDMTDIRYGIPTPKQRADEYGLSDGSRATLIVYKVDGTEEKLYVGDSAPVGWRTYVQTLSGDIVVVPGKLEDTLFIRAQDFRDRALLRYDLSESKQARIQSAAGILDVFEDDGHWWVRGFGRANLDRVDELFVGLANLRFEGWLDDVATQGIEEPLFDVTVSLKNGMEHSFKVGTSMPMGRLVQTSSGATGFVSDAALAMLNQGPNHVADPRGFPFSSSESVKVSIRKGERLIEFVDSSGDGAWHFTGSDVSAAELVDQFSGVKAAYAPIPPSGFADAPMIVSIYSHGGDVRTIRVGRAKESPSRWCAMDTLQGVFYYLDDTSWNPVLSHWMSTADDVLK